MPREKAAQRQSNGSENGGGVSKSAYRLTCSRCRARKVKCDGSTPECKICRAYGQTCHYDKPPPMSQILAMTQRIQEIEQASGHFEDEQMAASIPADRHLQEQSLPSAYHSVQPQDVNVAHDALPLQFCTPFQSTSAVQEPTQSVDNLTPAPNQEVRAPAMTSYQLAEWHERALEACSHQLRLPVETVRHLLTTYWSWVFPAFMFVSRPQFLKDTSTGGKYSSPLLIAVMCLHATRLTDHARAEDLHSHVRYMLGREIHSTPSIPLVQALLQLSARELGNGSLHQAWLYSGMAFRLATDMGIMTAATSPAADATEAHVRGQLAWSCYLWDKAVSLYLGRTPSLPESPNFEPSILDESIEEEIWNPVHSNAGAVAFSAQTHGISCFKNFCKLGVIIQDVLATIYAMKPNTDIVAFVQHARNRLEAWRANSPPHLTASATSSLCPPPHILSQNMLFYTTTILLHRPFRSNSRCRVICTQATTEMEHLLQLLETTLGLQHVSYLMAYCAYTAATVALLDLHDQIDGSQARLNTFLRTLYSLRTSCPGIQRSIDIVIKAMATIPPTQPLRSELHTVPERPNDPGPLPMFPLDDLDAFSNPNHAALRFGTLDPFAMDWPVLTDDIFSQAEF